MSAVKHASELLGPPGELGGHGLIDYLILHGLQRAQQTGSSGIDRRLVYSPNQVSLWELIRSLIPNGLVAEPSDASRNGWTGFCFNSKRFEAPCEQLAHVYYEAYSPKKVDPFTGRPKESTHFLIPNELGAEPFDASRNGWTGFPFNSERFGSPCEHLSPNNWEDD